jgi:hypothetical protein
MGDFAKGADLRCPDKHFKDEFLVWDPEDRFHACICYGEDEVRETIAQFKDASLLRVRRTTVGELARDVTADFFPEDDADDAFGIPSPSSLRRWIERRV